MSKLTKLNDRKTALVAAMRKLSDTAADEEREFTAEEQASYDQLKADLATSDKLIALQEEVIAHEKSAITHAAGEHGHTAPATQLGPEPAASGPTITREKDPNAFETFGDFLESAKAFERGAVDARLQKYGVPSGMNTVTPSEGGFLVPPEYASVIIRKAFEQGSVLSRVNRQQLSGTDTMKIPFVDETSRADGSRGGGVRGYWKGQGSQGTASKPSTGQLTLELKKLMCLGYVTDEMLKDYSFTGQLLTGLFADEITFLVEDAIINGTGGDQPLGVTNAACKVQVAKESGQAAATIVGDNLLKMVARFPVKSRKSGGAAFFYNADCEPQLWKLAAYSTAVSGASTTAAAQPLILPSGMGLNRSEFPTFLGIPLIPVEYCATVGTAGDIVLADLSQYLFVDQGQIEMASSIHLRFDYAEEAFRVMYRCDGQPMWKSALTPYKGSATISPVITLAVRA